MYPKLICVVLIQIKTLIMEELFTVLNERFSNNYAETLENEFVSLGENPSKEDFETFFKKMPCFSALDVINFGKYCIENKENMESFSTEQEMLGSLNEWLTKVK